MKCRIQFIGNILLNNLSGKEEIFELKKLAKNHLSEKLFSFSNFRYKFIEEGGKDGNEELGHDE